MHKEVLCLTKSGLTKSYKGLIFISEKAWASCYRGFVTSHITYDLSEELQIKFRMRLENLLMMPFNLQCITKDFLKNIYTDCLCSIDLNYVYRNTCWFLRFFAVPS